MGLINPLITSPPRLLHATATRTRPAHGRNSLAAPTSRVDSRGAGPVVDSRGARPGGVHRDAFDEYSLRVTAKVVARGQPPPYSALCTSSSAITRASSAMRTARPSSVLTALI